MVAADVYSVAPHAGRGGWTWYTGAAGWMHRAGLEGILGIRREGGWLIVDPCIPADWPGFEATVNLAGTRIAIQVDAPAQRGRGITRALLDGSALAVSAGGVRVALDGTGHTLVLTL